MDLAAKKNRPNPYKMRKNTDVTISGKPLSLCLHYALETEDCELEIRNSISQKILIC